MSLGATTAVRAAGSGRSRMAGNAVLVIAFVIFAWANFSYWRHTGRPTGLGTTVLDAWTAALFLLRRQARDVSTSWLAWVAAPIGSFAILLARPTGAGASSGALAGEIVQLVGLVAAIASLSALGRSFGVVAANRGVKRSGPYRLIRHPIYCCYLVGNLGYVLENPSLRNAAVVCLGTLFQLVRIDEEERVLRHDPSYRDYCGSVRYRLLPFLY